ncbi:hypothetical protein ACLOJK_029713 [Asimina triloba]
MAKMGWPTWQKKERLASGQCLAFATCTWLEQENIDKDIGTRSAASEATGAAKSDDLGGAKPARWYHVTSYMEKEPACVASFLGVQEEGDQEHIK